MRRRRYPSDLADPQWALLVPHIPPAKAGGRPRTTDLRTVLDAILYLLRTGCQWRQLAADFPPWPTVHGYFRRWRIAGFWTVLHRALYPLARAAAGRTLDRRSPSSMVSRSRRAKRGRSRLRWPRAGERTETPHSGRCARPSARRPVEPANMSTRLPAPGCWPAWRRFGRRSARSSRMLAPRAASSPASSGAMAGNCKSSSAGSVFSRSLG